MKTSPAIAGTEERHVPLLDAASALKAAQFRIGSPDDVLFLPDYETESPAEIVRQHPAPASSVPPTHRLIAFVNRLWHWQEALSGQHRDAFAKIGGDDLFLEALVGLLTRFRVQGTVSARLWAREDFDDDFRDVVLGLFGFEALLPLLGSRERHRLFLVLPHIHRFADQVTASAAALSAIMDAPVSIEPFEPAVTSIDPGDTSLLGRRGSRLGRQADAGDSFILGRRVVEAGSRHRLIVGNLDESEAQTLEESGWIRREWDERRRAKWFVAPKSCQVAGHLLPFWLDAVWEVRVGGAGIAAGPWLLGDEGRSALGRTTRLASATGFETGFSGQGRRAGTFYRLFRNRSDLSENAPPPGPLPRKPVASVGSEAVKQRSYDGEKWPNAPRPATRFWHEAMADNRQSSDWRSPIRERGAVPFGPRGGRMSQLKLPSH